jgi:hypothetical protein
MLEKIFTKMVFDKNINIILDLLNEVLVEFAAPEIFHNSGIKLNQQLLLEGYIQFRLQRNEKHVPLYFEISAQSGIRVDVDRARETFEWDLKDIVDEKYNVLSSLRMLLTSFVLVEYHGKYYTKIIFFNNKGICIDIYKYQEKLFFKGKRKDRLYFPVYDIKK